MLIDRRLLLQLMTATTGAAFGGLTGVSSAQAEDGQFRHGNSLFGSLKYPEGFTHFDYTNPDAPKGGRVRLYNIGGFDSLNPFTFKGTSAGRMSLTINSLMTSSLDEPSTQYCLIAESVSYPDDYSSVTFRLRKEAKFHDGTPITASDVMWSMDALKKSHPQYAFYYKDVERSEAPSDHEVTFHFTSKGNREMPFIVGQLSVLSKAWWTSKNDKGEQRDINSTSLEAPLGNGPYKVSDVKPGRSITFQRVEDYWGRDLAVNAGKNNFDEVVQIYFRDQTVALEAFKGDQYDYRLETSSKDWATAYDVPAVKKGRIVREEITLKDAQGMQSFAFNIRRAKFADPRVRQAFNLAFDFEWSNTNLFYGQYSRTYSYFSGSELAATGLPDAAEMPILNEFKDQIPPEVFTTQYTNPVNGDARQRRQNLRTAVTLLREAGWKPGPDRKLQNQAGEPFEVEFLLVSPLFERIVLPYIKQLRLLGITATTRIVDDAQYTRRVQSFDYDIIVGSWGQSLSPGNEQREYWGSAAADREGSRNLVGIKNPAVDGLVDKIIFARDRTELVAATRALDRVLLWNHYVVPMWFIPYERTVRWNRFGKPETLPDYSVGFPTIWWWDEELAAKTEAAK